MSAPEFVSREPENEPELLSMEPGTSPGADCALSGCYKPVAYEATYSDGSHAVYCLAHGIEEAGYAGLERA